MIFEVSKGRECASALTASLQAITALQISECEKVRLIELQASQLENYRLLDANWSARLTNQAELSSIERQKLRNKVRKRGRIIFGESVGIGVFLALLLL